MIRTLYSPLTKAEENEDGTLTVEGIASAETVDATGETVLASAMEAALPDFFAYGTGNLREMHQLSAAGTVDVAEVNDEGLTRITATVVDPVAVLKCKSGVYKGFSIGGKVLARDPKDRKVITKIKLVEISLVDRPCCPEAKIEVWKAESEGTSMDPETEGAAAPEPVTQPVPAPAAAPTVSVPAAETAKAVPAPVEASVAELAPSAPVVEPPAEVPPAAAVASEPAPVAVETPAPPEGEPAADEAAKADAVEPAAPTALARALAAVDALEGAVTKAAGGEDLAKGMYTVRSFADVLSSIAYIVSDLKSEAEFEGDASPVPAKMQAWLLAGVPLFKEMAAEEIDELVARVTAQKAEGAAALTATAEADALTKAHAAVADETAALKAQIDERESALSKLADRVEPLAATVDALSKRLAAVEAQPAPAKTAGTLAKAAPNSVSKEQDSAGTAVSEPAAVALSTEDVAKALEAMPAEQRAMELMKASLALGRRIG